MKSVCVGLVLTAAYVLSPALAEVSVSEALRTIDLTSQLVKESVSLTFSNDGADTVKSLVVAAEKEWADRTAFIGATSGTSDKTYLRVTKEGDETWRVDLKKPLAASASQTIDVEIIFGKAVELLPKEISQKERQLVLFNGNHYVYSPYKVLSQTTKVLLPSSTVESYSKNVKPVSLAESTITYGPYSNVEPKSRNPLSVHYENNNPFLVVSRLERTIELSMWGNIAVEETVDVRHNGAILRGPFSRYEFQRENSGVSSVKSFKTVLPAAASDVYYRDDIGNISTSALRVLDDAVELDLRPRFPLFGGWKTHYLVGYNVPSYEYLYFKGDRFALSMRLLDHIFDDMLVEDMTVKIILPEGAEVVKFHSPYPTHRFKDEVIYTYLDVSGRPVVVLSNEGELTEKHIQDFQLEFTFSKAKMIREPLMVILAFFLFFLLTIIYVRLDFSITKDEGSEARMKVAGICEKILSHQDKRDGTYAAFDAALGRLKSSKDNSAFTSALKKISADQKAETQYVSDLMTGLKALSPEVAEKVSEMQKADRSLREYQANQSQLVEKLVSGKMPKHQFVDQESGIIRKKEEAKERIAAISTMLRSV